MRQYDHTAIEKKWQKAWDTMRLHKTSDKVKGKDNFYLLVEFPYPSGNLHVGHWYAFSIPDILARMFRMQGKNVLYPIGFDAFGLPAENAAIKNNLNPAKWTRSNMEYMKKQMRSMGTSFDWSREVATCDPAYYKWTQWQFLQFYKNGLAYRKETAVNWCPSCKTVLANEQVVTRSTSSGQVGTCERCGSEVEQKEMLQWNLKITDYADRLVDDLESLDWPEPIKDAQRSWIGRSEGAEFDFFLDFRNAKINARTDAEEKKAHITVFTTRPDTLFGATYLVLAPEHPWVTAALEHKTVLKNHGEVATYVDTARKKSDLERQTEAKDKTGVELKGVRAINPATGQDIPLFVADYVLGGYGTGAVMGVPAHDDRDFAFAERFRVPIKQVVLPLFGKENKRDSAVHRETVSAVVRDKKGRVMLLNWPQYKWTTVVIGGINKGETPEKAAEREVLEETGYKARAVYTSPVHIHSYFFADHKNEWRSRRDRAVLLELVDDTPLPIAAEEADKHSATWMSSEEAMQEGMYGNNKLALQLALRKTTAYTTASYGEDAVLVNSDQFDGMSSEQAKKAITDTFGRAKKTYRLRDWVVSRQRYWGVPIPIIHCKDCGAQPVPDKDLPVKLPEVKDYLPEGSGKSPLAKAKKWVSVKCPKCKGKAEREIDTFDTFVDSSWYFLRYTDPNNKKVFADKKKQANWMPVSLYSGGAEHTTMHVLYSRFWHKALFDLGLVADKEPYTSRKNRSLIMGPDGQKMSKSRGNVIDPDQVVELLGADTVRMYLAFIGPYAEVSSYPWNPDGVVGVRRFLERIWRAQEYIGTETPKEVKRLLHKTIQKVGEDNALLKFNTAISALMVFLNVLEKEKRIAKADFALLLKLLAQFAPHMSEELWYSLGLKTSIHKEEWPKFDSKLVQDDVVTIVIQINGKTRGVTHIAAHADEKKHEEVARAVVQTRLGDTPVRKVIVVKGRLVNFVA